MIWNLGSFLAMWMPQKWANGPLTGACMSLSLGSSSPRTPAVPLYFSDEEAAARFAAAVRRAAMPWLVDVVQAYKSVAVFFDADQVRFAPAAQALRELEAPPPAAATGGIQVALHRILCCYEL